MTEEPNMDFDKEPEQRPSESADAAISEALDQTDSVENEAGDTEPGPSSTYDTSNHSEETTAAVNQDAESIPIAYAEAVEAIQVNAMNSAALPQQFQNVAAKGGSVAAVALGTLTIFGAFVTQWSIFNAVVGMMLGLWGLQSPLKRTTWIGIGLCFIGLAMCMAFYSNS